MHTEFQRKVFGLLTGIRDRGWSYQRDQQGTEARQGHMVCAAAFMSLCAMHEMHMHQRNHVTPFKLSAVAQADAASACPAACLQNHQLGASTVQKAVKPLLLPLMCLLMCLQSLTTKADTLAHQVIIHIPSCSFRMGLH